MISADRLKAYCLLIFSCSILSCSSNYQVVQSRRSEYPINTSLAADSAMVKKYWPYKLRLDSQMNGVIGHSDIALTKKFVQGESLLGDFFADAAFSEARKIDPQIDFAIPSTNGGLRNDLPQGPITLSNVFELMPFENELIVFTLKGEDVASLLDFIAKTGGQPIANLRLRIADNKIAAATINGKAFDPAKEYRVLTSDYIAGGGDGLNSFKNPVAKKILGLKVRDALILYIKGKEALNQKITASLDGRTGND